MSQVTLKALGLNYSPNNLSLPDGSLVEANDVIIRRDDTIESRRGIREYSEGLGVDTSVVPKQLMEYKDRILVNYADKIAFDTGVLDSNGKKIFDDFSGSYSPTQTGLRIKYIEANKNLYFTTSAGIKKISAASASDFSTASGYITNSGAVKALDFTAALDITQGQLNGFLPSDSAVAYRVVWGYKDANDNLLLGSPSNRQVVYNYLTDSMSMDMNRILVALDDLAQSGAGLITDGNYSSLYATPLNTEASTLLTNVTDLAIKLDADLVWGTDSGSGVPLNLNTIEVTGGICIITASSGNPSSYIAVGDWIQVSGMPTAFSNMNGFWSVSAVDATTIRFVPTNTTTIVSTAVGASAQVGSYNYRHITATGDAGTIYTTALDDTTLTTPATAFQIGTINNALSRILDRLKAEKTAVITTAFAALYLTPIIITASANVDLKITIPTTITSEYFVQVYRTSVFTATDGQSLGDNGGIPVVPDDEMRLVFEAFPTTADITSGFVSYTDNYPVALVQNNTNLYTNPQTGEGILNSNEPPPFAKDINRFNNVTFYANTRTKQRISNFQLLGVSNIASGDKLTIGSDTTSDTYTFVTGVAESTPFTMSGTAGQFKTAAQNNYFTINTPTTGYYVWYRYDGAGTDPAPAGRTGIMVDVITAYSLTTVRDRTVYTINEYVYDFVAAAVSTDQFTVTNVDTGISTDATIGTISSRLAIGTITQGNGENASLKQVLLSSLTSAGQAIEETATSLARVINQQSSSIVNAYYTSGDNTPPGQINLEEKTLTENVFYVLGSTSGVGSSFNPDISPDVTGAAYSIATSTVITSAAHGLINGDQIMITASTGTNVNGVRTVTYINANSFSIPVTVASSGTLAYSKIANLAVSTNEAKANRIYYSKANQPEAVPLLNYFDIAAQDKEILRILPLRTTLFVFKEDGTYRVSGQVAPFVTSLLDTSCIVIAPDSVDVSNNIIYAWTSKGITPVSENGASFEVSRPIDTEVLRLSSGSFTNFKTVTWGVGYDSDSSYTIYTNSATTDTVATIAFRYCTLTNTWTNFIRTQTCGLNKKDEDKLYMGSGTSNLIECERKSFNRTDYADRDFTVNADNGSITSGGLNITFSDVDSMAVGDVLVQNQELTIYVFNKLLTQLDADPTTGFKNYYSTLAATTGDSMRSKLVALATKMDLDSGLSYTDYAARIASKSGTISSNSVANPTVLTTSAAHGLIPGRIVTIAGTQPAGPPVPTSILGTYTASSTGTYGSSTTFTIPVNVITAGVTSVTFNTAANLNDPEDIMACYNEIVNRLNTDPGANYVNYKLITYSTPFEAVITAIDRSINLVTVNLPLQWVVGPMTVYKAIPCSIVYAPCTFGDPLNSKQINECTIMFNNKAFTSAEVGFCSDLRPEFKYQTFYGQGNGIFGSYSSPGFGGGFFGGASNSAPFRTYIPRYTQRCRFIVVQFNHSTARETWNIYGITLSGNMLLSNRAYR